MPVTRDDFFNLARQVGNEGRIPPENHLYFEEHRDRVWATISRFNLLQGRCGRLLDIGPYFSYTPFLWKNTLAEHVSVFEGDSPETQALRPVYLAKNIEVTFDDLFEIFHQKNPGTGRLPYPDNSFDIICCWETMEHFNFNPVPFIRELHRITRPGGSVCITVPNMAKLAWRLKLLLGKSTGTNISIYQSTAGNRFLGTHWREYTLAEIASLFEQNSFHIEFARHLQTFKNRPLSAVEIVRRALARPLTSLIPSFGNLCVVKAKKASG